ncbi:MAG: hypothetical protein ACRD3J_19120, partial [Thermoanaerobaculia bacterium]
DQVRVNVQSGIGAGARSLGASLSPPVFGRMNDEQLFQAASIYLFDMLVQNPDRRRGNENCFVVGSSLVAIDFAECFSFLYPVVGGSADPWRVPAGISAAHVFRGTLDRSSTEWPVLFEKLNGLLGTVLSDSTFLVPEHWQNWMDRVRHHLAEVRSHFDEFRWDILRSIV